MLSVAVGAEWDIISIIAIELYVIAASKKFNNIIIRGIFPSELKSGIRLLNSLRPQHLWHRIKGRKPSGNDTFKTLKLRNRRKIKISNFELEIINFRIRTRSLRQQHM